ncbi:TRAP transporter small permease [Halomonas sp. MCCC 1A11036]|uniref:TRAP transporter small permease protein n=1 Tax=Billgrantia zhangzhouensis TaxID=2733481 RepID=A0ABS9AA22_9GAMM|nr:TRAP transporter small permease [Halomonas zhangzhouensis]MCE8018756.1 TRAP transporter small permease [Halomonas zhangzhouensis]
MPSLRQRVLAVSRTLTLTLAATLLLINLAAILYGVFMRYLAGGAPIWTDELARFLIIATVMLAAGAVWVEGGHMRVALIERLLPRALARVLNLYQWLLTLVLALGGAWFSYRYALSVGMFTTSGLGISRTIPLMSLPLGFALLAWHALWYGPAPLPTITEEVA